jgi:hypothetical protein
MGSETNAFAEEDQGPNRAHIGMDRMDRTASLRRVSASLDLLQVRTTMHKASALEENVSQC